MEKAMAEDFQESSCTMHIICMYVIISAHNVHMVPVTFMLHTWTTFSTRNISCIFTHTNSTTTTGARLGTCTLLGYHTFTTSC